jgi:uncharacterized protein (DUF4415 family)
MQRCASIRSTSAIASKSSPAYKQNVSRGEWQKAVRGRIAKQRISIMLDAPIIARYKAIAGERGYQTLINDTLRRAVEGEYFVQAMRNAIREELVEYVVEKKRGKP